MSKTLEVFLNKIECLGTDDVGDDTLYVSTYKYRDVKGKPRKYYEQWISSEQNVTIGDTFDLNHPVVFDMTVDMVDAEQLGV